jgi:hypothetical protein
MGSGGYFSQLGTKLQTPFSSSMSWTQLAAVVVFVLVVLFAWRQVTLFIAQEI